MAREERFDYVVLGGGSGGVASARRAAAHGRKVALIEANRLGGTCVNVGCVPKKIMWSAAALVEAMHDARGYGFAVSPPELDWNRLKKGRDDYVAFLNAVYLKNLENEGIRRIQGFGRFVAPGTLEVNGGRVVADHVLVATGGKPAVVDIPGGELGITSDGFFELTRRPDRVAIVGAGYVAVEFAGILRALGSEVTVVMRGNAPLKSFDVALQTSLREHMEASGIVLARCSEVVRVELSSKGERVLVTHDNRRLGPFDCIIWAIGRVPCTPGIGLETLGVRTDPEGHAVVDEFQNTNVSGIYAVGDVTGRMALTPVAIAAGRRLADRLFGGEPDARLDYEDVPTVVFSHPPIGSVGLDEEAARKQYGTAVKVYERRFMNLHYALTEHKPKTTVKLVTVGEDERVVGIHVIGLGADEMIQGFAVALKMGARKSDLDRTVAIHPTGAEELVTLR
jgi:glutathione reductase (NADPH)